MCLQRLSSSAILIIVGEQPEVRLHEFRNRNGASVMKSIFNLDSPVMTILTEIADLIILNLIYLFFCMPIVTIGAATAALYRVMLNYEKERV